MGNHLFSATDLMSLLLSLCCALLFHSLPSPPPASLYFCFVFLPNFPPNSACPNFTLPSLCSLLPPVYFRFLSFSLSQSCLHSVFCLIMTPAGPSCYLIYHGQFSASCSQWAIWVCNDSLCALTLSLSAKHSKRLSLGCLH